MRRYRFRMYDVPITLGDNLIRVVLTDENGNQRALPDAPLVRSDVVALTHIRTMTMDAATAPVIQRNRGTNST